MNRAPAGKKVAIAVPSTAQHNPFIKAMLDVGLLPENCRRFVIDSGDPEGVMTIYFDAFLDDRIFEEPVIRSITELAQFKRKRKRK